MLVVEVPNGDVFDRREKLLDGEQPRAKREHVRVVDREPLGEPVVRALGAAQSQPQPQPAVKHLVGEVDLEAAREWRARADRGQHRALLRDPVRAVGLRVEHAHDQRVDSGVVVAEERALGREHARRPGGRGGDVERRCTEPRGPEMQRAVIDRAASRHAVEERDRPQLLERADRVDRTVAERTRARASRARRASRRCPRDPGAESTRALGQEQEMRAQAAHPGRVVPEPFAGAIRRRRDRAHLIAQRERADGIARWHELEHTVADATRERQRAPRVGALGVRDQIRRPRRPHHLVGDLERGAAVQWHRQGDLQRGGHVRPALADRHQHEHHLRRRSRVTVIDHGIDTGGVGHRCDRETRGRPGIATRRAAQHHDERRLHHTTSLAHVSRAAAIASRIGVSTSRSSRAWWTATNACIVWFSAARLASTASSWPRAWSSRRRMSHR